ncbi:MAG: OadG family transporter subunit [Clostridia bacterium]
MGFAIVFAVLILIAVIILITGAVVKRLVKEPEKKTVENAVPEKAPSEIQRPPVILENTDDKTAALIMAIVSNQSNIPLDRLAFRSIKLLEEN